MTQEFRSISDRQTSNHNSLLIFTFMD